MKDSKILTFMILNAVEMWINGLTLENEWVNEVFDFIGSNSSDLRSPTHFLPPTQFTYFSFIIFSRSLGDIKLWVSESPCFHGFSAIWQRLRKYIFAYAISIFPFFHFKYLKNRIRDIFGAFIRILWFLTNNFA